MSHCVGKDLTLEEIARSIEEMINGQKKWPIRRREAIETLFPAHPHDIPLTSEMHLGKLKVQHVSLDTHRTVRKVGRLFCDKINDIADKEGAPGMSINGAPMKTTIDPCQHHQQNDCF